MYVGANTLNMRYAPQSRLCNEGRRGTAGGYHEHEVTYYASTCGALY